MSNDNDKIVTNGVEITNHAHQWLMETLKDTEDFDMGENGDEASCRLSFYGSSGNSSHRSATSQKLAA